MSRMSHLGGLLWFAHQTITMSRGNLHKLNLWGSQIDLDWGGEKGSWWQKGRSHHSPATVVESTFLGHEAVLSDVNWLPLSASHFLYFSFFFLWLSPHWKGWRDSLLHMVWKICPPGSFLSFILQVSVVLVLCMRYFGLFWVWYRWQSFCPVFWQCGPSVVNHYFLHGNAFWFCPFQMRFS